MSSLHNLIAGDLWLGASKQGSLTLMRILLWHSAPFSAAVKAFTLYRLWYIGAHIMQHLFIESECFGARHRWSATTIIGSSVESVNVGGESITPLPILTKEVTTHIEWVRPHDIYSFRNMQCMCVNYKPGTFACFTYYVYSLSKHK